MTTGQITCYKPGQITNSRQAQRARIIVKLDVDSVAELGRLAERLRNLSD